MPRVRCPKSAFMEANDISSVAAAELLRRLSHRRIKSCGRALIRCYSGPNSLILAAKFVDHPGCELGSKYLIQPIFLLRMAGYFAAATRFLLISSRRVHRNMRPWGGRPRR